MNVDSTTTISIFCEKEFLWKVHDSVVNHGHQSGLQIELAILIVVLFQGGDCFLSVPVGTRSPASSRPWCSLVQLLGVIVVRKSVHPFVQLVYCV